MKMTKTFPSGEMTTVSQLTTLARAASAGIGVLTAPFGPLAASISTLSQDPEIVSAVGRSELSYANSTYSQ
jgi:hypothetical protein